MARAKAQPPRRLSASQLRSLASRGQTGRSTIRKAVTRQRSAVAKSSLRQPQRVVRRTVSDSVSVRQPRQTIQKTSRSTFPGGRASSTSIIVETKRRQPLQQKRIKLQTKRPIKVRTQRFAQFRTSSIEKPAPKRARAQQRRGGSVARQPFILNFANVSEKARGSKDVVFTSLFKTGKGVTLGPATRATKTVSVAGTRGKLRAQRRKVITRTVVERLDTPFGINFGRVSDDGIVNTPQEFADFFVEPSDQQREAIQTARGFKQPRVSGAGSGPINFLDDFLGGRL